MNIFKFAVAGCALAALVACGGGGGGDTAAVALSAYAGNWKATSCEQNPEVTIGSVAVYEQVYLKDVQASGATSVSGIVEAQLFDNATCTGVARATHRNGFSFSIDGTLAVNGKTVDKITVTDAAIGGGLSSGTTVVVNGITYPGDYFTRTSTDKELSLVEGTNWFFGTGTTAAGQYPTALEATAALVKQ